MNFHVSKTRRHFFFFFLTQKGLIQVNMFSYPRQREREGREEEKREKTGSKFYFVIIDWYDDDDDDDDLRLMIWKNTAFFSSIYEPHAIIIIIIIIVNFLQDWYHMHKMNLDKNFFFENFLHILFESSFTVIKCQSFSFVHLRISQLFSKCTIFFSGYLILNIHFFLLSFAFC